jgi:hypothetical protein
VSEWLSDRIVEEAGRRIYEAQQSRLSDQSTYAARRVWRSKDVPVEFWDSYLEDARAALAATHPIAVGLLGWRHGSPPLKPGDLSSDTC